MTGDLTKEEQASPPMSAAVGSSLHATIEDKLVMCKGHLPQINKPCEDANQDEERE
ncbi:hypothetical protein NQZ68_004344 [Dissostichus eleginoides]|nr:hypothetical protein NQZ68_004344 [Dissostichus eleginoides]